jgi:hypothetical protein
VWFDLDACELDFCERSPHRIVNEAVLGVDAASAFEMLASAEELGAWLHDFVACRWTSAPPHGVGSTRVVDLRLFRVNERFIAWRPGERLTFTLTATSLPIFTRAVEDLELSPVTAGSTRVRWTVHYELPPWMRPLNFLARAIFGPLFARSVENMTRHAAERRAGISPPGRERTR